MRRYLERQVKNDLKRKMVFVGGARQVGKTTLAKTILPKNGLYLNWDITRDREKILKDEIPVAPLIVFDEIHKYRKWRNFLKGIFDARGKGHQILITGSARLDYYRFGGDSLQGRYHYLRLHQLSVAELNIETNQDFMQLIKLGGFPEPFLEGSETQAKRWSQEYRSRLIREDLATLEAVKHLGTIELLMLRLPELVGSPLSINSLREDLDVSHKAVSNWINILERLYAVFRVSPFGSPRIKAVKKEQKHYHYDWTLVDDRSARFENLVALHLLKWVHFLQDTEAKNIELAYLRDETGREVDFAIVENGSIKTLIECKWNDADISKSLSYMKKKFPESEAWQISAIGEKDYLSKDGIRVSPAVKFLKDLV